MLTSSVNRLPQTEFRLSSDVLVQDKVQINDWKVYKYLAQYTFVSN